MCMCVPRSLILGENDDDIDDGDGDGDGDDELVAFNHLPYLPTLPYMHQ